MSAIEAITVPKWGLTMTEGTVSQWLVEEGAVIQIGDEVVDMETSKIVNTVESIVSGKLRRIVAQPGETLEIAALLAVLADDDVPDNEVEAFIANYVPEGVASTDVMAKSSAAPKEVAIDQAETSLEAPEELDDSDVKTTPVARRLARELGVNLHECQATGRGGRVGKADVEAAWARIQKTTNDHPEDSATPEAEENSNVEPKVRIEQQGVAQTPNIQPLGNSEFKAIPMNAMRRTIADRLQSSKQTAPHFRVTVDAELDALLAIRNQVNQSNPETNVSVNDFLIKACACALIKVPELNIQFDEASQTIRQFSNADIAVAVAIEGGLVTPIINTANRQSLSEISNRMRDLAARAKSGQLTAEEFQGGTFCISNLGMYGVRQFDAIINPPQGAILAVGGGEQRAVVREGDIQVATVMTLSLSSDHRVIDGAQAAEFMRELKRLIESPALMLA
ncbi:2-oxo acid dehydrogenase subunit E2 [Pseudomaricurvus alkylphenolicus]|uniref:dihydrolipoamide acetyltransferase family protein n=1 Tax=Pseudomaricurvus alkylphenolicus TaxID=1306991 RepID=UPI001424620D|nr:dihydrolipoamide acetyltransferase family protein [Pseudomaricurvus alkylphenolicus]NIB41649.1 2-oxo acid dehydrogenase subunit E2 [Pseudomaricurvus alkylphenolicus]